MEADQTNQAKSVAAQAVPAGLSAAELATLDRMSPTYRRARIAELLRDRGFRGEHGIVETRVQMATCTRMEDGYAVTTAHDAGHVWRLHFTRAMMIGLVSDVIAGLNAGERRTLKGLQL
jgi:hypothetical protein